MVIDVRVFKHNGLWLYYRYNKTNSEQLLLESKDDNLRKLVNFLDHVAYSKFKFVPSHLFNDDNSLRVTSVLSLKDDLIYFYEITTCRWKSIVEEGILSNKLTGHNKVLIPILTKFNKALAIEIPVWCETFFDTDNLSLSNLPAFNQVGQVTCSKTLTGHIDLLTYEDGKIWIWDYKPNFENLNQENFQASKQIDLYRDLLAILLGIDSSFIRMGWFNKTHEYIVL